MEKLGRKRGGRGGGGRGGGGGGARRGAASKADDFDHAAGGAGRSGDDITVSGVDKVEVVATFDAMGLSEDLLRGIYAYGFERPSAIQQRAILPIMRGRDVIAQSQSGTGKTAVFSIGILQTIDTSTRELQALVLSPTRELAEQTQKVLLALGDYMSVACHVCIGGTSIGNDIRALEKGVHVVSGTPGRTFDMIRRRCLDTRHLKMFVIDEADEMLNQGFKEQIYEIYRYLPPESQVVLISATMPQVHIDLSQMYRYTSCGSCSQFDSSLPLARIFGRAGNPHDDEEIHDEARLDSRQARRANAGRDQAVLRCRRERGVEVRHPL